LDEADRMLDIGFLPDLQRILSFLPKQRTTLLFSATFSNDIKRLAKSYLQDPVTIEVARSNETAATVTQRFFAVDGDDKRRAVGHLVHELDIKQAFVFVNSKLGCARLARALERDGFKTAALHGDKSQDERLKSLDAFKRGDVQLLVCTDVAARGLDIKDVPAVFNVDIPFNAEDYVHRIGRTGRAGAEGLAVSFVARSDNKLLAEVEKLTHTKADVETIAWGGRPSGVRNEGQRRWLHEEKSADQIKPAFRQPRMAPRDPWFDKPYEPSEAAAPPSWEAQGKTTRLKSRGLSSHILSKAKTPALFQAAKPAIADAD
jgi:superfamily II DNA/RNA helicase